MKPVIFISLPVIILLWCCQPLGATITIFDYLQDFDSFPLGTVSGVIHQEWENGTGDDLNWTVHEGPTPSLSTGPDYDHTGDGRYMYIESSSPGYPSKTAYLLSPWIDISSMESRSPALAFWYHMYGSTMGSLSVDVYDGLTWYNDVMTPISGDQGNTWRRVVFDLDGFSGQIRLRFRGTTGSNYYSDIAIDDVFIYENMVCYLPYIQNFDGFPAGITQYYIDDYWQNPLIGDDGDWTVRSGSTPSVGTGPSSDHTSGSGQYIFVEASTGENPGPNASADLISKSLDLRGYDNPKLIFWYHMYGANMGTLHLDMNIDNVWVEDFIPPISGNQGNRWYKKIVDLSSIADEDKFLIKFRAETGTDYLSDMAIDDVSIVGSVPAQSFKAQSMMFNHRECTMTLLQDHRVLVVGDNEGTGEESEVYDYRKNVWNVTGFLSEGRYLHTATLLPDGKVLVTGGAYNDGGNVRYRSSCEIFDPATNTWEDTAPMNSARGEHTATLLPDSSVLVVGGRNYSPSLGYDITLDSAEIYSGGIWTTLPSMSDARQGHASVLLQNGNVFVIGGYDDNTDTYLNSTTIFNSNTHTWMAGNSLTTARAYHTATATLDNRILVVGGIGGGSSFPLDSAEIYNGSWTDAGNVNVEIFYHTAVLLPDGKVAVFGGMTLVGPDYWVYIYHPDSNIWEKGGFMQESRSKHASVLLPGGSVLTVGGTNNQSIYNAADIYIPERFIESRVSELVIPRYYESSQVLPSGNVLVSGGYSPISGETLASSEIYSPSTNTWVISPDNMGITRQHHTSTLLPNGKVLVCGGKNDTLSSIASAELYDYTNSTNPWSSYHPMGQNHCFHTATLLPNGKVLVAGGVNNGNTVTSSCTLFDYETTTWEATDNLIFPRKNHTANLLPNGKVLIAGGVDSNNTAMKLCEIYDPRTGSWSQAASMFTRRYEHGAVLLHDGTVLVSGGFNGGTVDACEIYNPYYDEWRVIGDLDFENSNHSLTLLRDGNAILSGGQDLTYHSISNQLFYSHVSKEWFPLTKLHMPREEHSTVILDDGSILFTGGLQNGLFVDNLLVGFRAFELSERIYPRHYDSSLQPGITSLSNPLEYGETISIDADNLRGLSEASCGNSRQSAVNYPMVSIRAIDSDQTFWLNQDEVANFWEYPTYSPDIEISDLPNNIFPGYYYLTLYRHGIPSQSSIVPFDCSIKITTQPVSDSANEGDSITFSIDGSGIRFYQWYKDGLPISGAIWADYTTPPLTPGDDGAEIHCVAYNDCASEISAPATISVNDITDPTVNVISPDGGERWDFSPDTANRAKHLIAWSPSDNFGVESLSRVRISYTTYSGKTDGIVYACYDEYYDVPVCESLGAECRTPPTMIASRDSIAIKGENNQPNTYKTNCADGSSGTYKDSISIEQMRIYTDDGLPFTDGADVTVEVIVWSEGKADELDLFYSSSPGSAWDYVGTVPTSHSGYNTLSFNFSLYPTGKNKQIIRALFRNEANASHQACFARPYTDHDDLMFAVNEGLHWTCIADSEETSCPATNESNTDILEASDTTFLWDLPTAAEASADCQIFPSAHGAIKIEIWDGGDNKAEDVSATSFYFVQPTSTAIKTLILLHSDRIDAQYGVTCGGSDCADILLSKLVQLADHPKVMGKIIDFSDLGPAHPINTAYGSWVATNIESANAVASAIRDYLYDPSTGIVTNDYTNARYIILVGDDYQIPFYRMHDGNELYRENNYPGEVSLSTTTAIGAAFHGNRILTDNYYSELSPRDSSLDSGNQVYLMDMAIGRLVEHPVQMMNVVDNYLSHDGQINLIGSEGKVLVTGYGIFYNSSCNIMRLFSEEPYLKPTDYLLDADETPDATCGDEEYSYVELANTLFSDPVHKISYIGSHANHYNFQASDFSALSTGDMALVSSELNGTIVYTSGCHSGLPVPSTDTYNFDLPELMAEKGVLAFLGNTGYGWGTSIDSAYTEILMENLSLELLKNGSVTIGRALADVKSDYYLDQIRYDEFDEKALHQLTLFGIPNTIVLSSLEKNIAAEKELPKPLEEPDTSCLGSVCLTKKINRRVDNKTIPPGITVLELQFKFGEPPAYSQPSGPYALVSTDDLGDYYSLNNTISIEGGDAIQPLFVYNSTLSGTTPHGVLFTGGPYSEIPGFDPVVSEPQNDKTPPLEETDPAPIKSTLTASINSNGYFSAMKKSISEDQEVRLSMRTGYLEEITSAPGTYNEYLFNQMEYVIYYHLDSTDFTDPVINGDVDPGPSGFHTRAAMLAYFSVPVTDADSDVYRVLITYNDKQARPDISADGQWQSLDLVYNPGSTEWEGTLQLTSANTIYYVQAVDTAGNVTVLSKSGNDPYGGATSYGTKWQGPITFEIILPDGDGDGLPDDWENLYPTCLDAGVVNADIDYDYDNLLFSEELKYNTNPCYGDTDYGGDNDGSEVNHNRNPLDRKDDRHITIEIIDDMGTKKVLWHDFIPDSDNSLIDGYYYIYQSVDSPFFDPTEVLNGASPIPNCPAVDRPGCTNDGDGDDHSYVLPECSGTICYYKVWNYKLDTYPPEIWVINPDYDDVSGGATIDILGKYFVDGADVLIDGEYALGVTVVNGSWITCTVPPYSGSGPCTTGCDVDVEVLNPNGQNVIETDGFTYQESKKIFRSNKE